MEARTPCGGDAFLVTALDANTSPILIRTATGTGLLSVWLLTCAADRMVLGERMRMGDLQVLAYLDDVPHGGETIVTRTEVDGSAPKQLVLQASSSLRRP